MGTYTSHVGTHAWTPGWLSPYPSRCAQVRLCMEGVGALPVTSATCSRWEPETPHHLHSGAPKEGSSSRAAEQGQNPPGDRGDYSSGRALDRPAPARAGEWGSPLGLHARYGPAAPKAFNAAAVCVCVGGECLPPTPQPERGLPFLG